MTESDGFLSLLPSGNDTKIDALPHRRMLPKELDPSLNAEACRSGAYCSARSDSDE